MVATAQRYSTWEGITRGGIVLVMNLNYSSSTMLVHMADMAIYISADKLT
jgi:hypothetical protein